MRVRIEISMWMGKELGEDFYASSEMRSARVEEVPCGITMRDFLDGLAERFRTIREKVFEKEQGRLYPHLLMALNDGVTNPYDIYDRVLEDGDKVTILPMYLGG